MQRLSLCMIVKNEERWLASCLQSVKGLVDEMIIVDTGSSDRTVEIAESFGARVFPKTWENDFSKARNFSLEKATGDWILVLDADEVVSQRDHADIQELVQKPEAAMYFLTQNTYCEESATFGWIPNHLSNPEAKGYSGFVESPLVRLFRNDPRLRFHGIIHEHVQSSDPHLKSAHTSILIHHYGKYSSEEVMKKKDELYLNLGLSKCKNNPKDAQAFYELGVQYWSLQKTEEAREALLKAEKIDPRYVRPQIALAAIETTEKKYKQAIRRYAHIMEISPECTLPYLYLPPLLVEIKNYALAEEILTAGEKFVSDHPSFYINQGVVYQGLGRERNACASFEKALSLNPREPLALLNLGVSLMNLGEWQKSLQALDQVVTFPKWESQGWKRKAEWHFRRREFAEAISCLETSYAKNPADHECLYQMAVCLIQKGDTERARQKLRMIRSYGGFEAGALEKILNCHLAIGDRENAEIIRNELVKRTEPAGAYGGHP